MQRPEAGPGEVVRREHARLARAREIATRLASGLPVTDRQLDSLYPPAIRSLSSSYWTPLRVALPAARLLVAKPGARVLDIGSGAGKFCCVAALVTTAELHGIEQRSALVQHAGDLANLLGADRASFEQGRFETLDPGRFDGFYLFNPFEENEDRALAAVDREEQPGDDWFLDDVRRAQAFLEAARPGARVATYNGMGGPLPSSYELVERVQLRRALELWVKRA